jgi:hypothetical protein
MPAKLAEFIFKYFITDGAAFPEKYLWPSEREELVFSELGLTRRMLSKLDELESDEVKSEKEGKKEEEENSEKEKKQGAEDDMKDFLKDSFDPTLYDVSRVQLLITTFLLVRILLCQIIFCPHKVTSLGVRDGVPVKVQTNLDLVASLFFIIMRYTFDDLKKKLPKGTADEVTKKGAGNLLGGIGGNLAGVGISLGGEKEEIEDIDVEFDRSKELGLALKWDKKVSKAIIVKPTKSAGIQKVRLEKGDRLVAIEGEAIPVKAKSLKKVLQLVHKAQKAKDAEKDSFELTFGRVKEDTEERADAAKRDESISSITIESITKRLYPKSYFLQHAGKGGASSTFTRTSFDAWIKEQSGRLSRWGLKMITEIIEANRSGEKDKA